MIVNGQQYQSIWFEQSSGKILFINQNKLPFTFCIEELCTTEEALCAIKEMKVRGAPLIGVTAAFAMYLAVCESASFPDPVEYIDLWSERLENARPTALNLSLMVNMIREAIFSASGHQDRQQLVLELALSIMEEEKDRCLAIGRHGLELLRDISRERKSGPINILTHCNAGWLATVDFGTATAPVYMAHDEGIPVHVWVDETRPRNQGARLTAWELGQHGVPFTIIADNTGGHLMQNGMVDLVMVGTDRTGSTGDVANKIGTYLKALAARDNGIPFYVAAPSTSIDFSIAGEKDDVPIEERDDDELRLVDALVNESLEKARIIPDSYPVANYGFDITPARLVSGLITERGICEASSEGLKGLFPEKF